MNPLFIVTIVSSLFFPSKNIPEEEPKQAVTFKPYENVRLFQRRYIGLAPKWCQFCPAVKQRLPEVEWLDGDQESYEGCKPSFYPAVYDSETKACVWGDNLKDYDTVIASLDKANQYFSEKKKLKYEKRSHEPVGSLEGGKKAIEEILFLLGKNGHYRREGPGEDFELWGTKGKLPDDFTANWKTTNDTTVVTFLKKPSVNLIIVQLKLSGLTITPNRLTLNIDWAPDYPIDLN